MDQDKKHDKYCWKCCGTETTLKCSTCPRSFHDLCENPEEDLILSDWRCSVCKKLETSKNTEEELQRIPSIFKRVYSKCVDLITKKSAKRMKMTAESEDGSDDKDIVNAIDPIKMQAKVDSNAYGSLDEFLVDFQWFTHNCEVMYKNNNDRKKQAKNQLFLVSAEIDSVKTCLQCHINAENNSRWFTMVHHLPHLIIWAYRKNTKYWPAKVMSYDEHHVNVRFFGGYHKHENVPVTKCYLYSKYSPTNNFLKTCGGEFSLAIKEADQYLKNIRDKYGEFQLSGAKVKFDPSKYNEYIQDLISAIKIFPEGREVAQSGEAVESDFGDSTGSEPFVQSEMMGGSSTGQSVHDTDEDMFDENDDDSEISDDDDDTNSIIYYNTSLQHLAEGFDRICKRNAKLKERVLDLEKNHELEVKNLEESNTKLMDEYVQLEIGMENRIEALKETHLQELTELKEKYQGLIEQQKLAMEQCKREYSQCVKEAKSNKYCVSCGSSKPLDNYICDMECLKRQRENTPN